MAIHGPAPIAPVTSPVELTDAQLDGEQLHAPEVSELVKCIDAPAQTLDGPVNTGIALTVTITVYEQPVTDEVNVIDSVPPVNPLTPQAVGLVKAKNACPPLEINHVPGSGPP